MAFSAQTGMTFETQRILAKKRVSEIPEFFNTIATKRTFTAVAVLVTANGYNAQVVNFAKSYRGAYVVVKLAV